MFRVFAAAIVLSLAVIGPSLATPARSCTLDAEVDVVEGFTTGRDLDDYGEPELRIYLRAFIDGLTIAPLLDAPEACMRAAFACLTGLTEDDMLAVLKGYLSSHREELDEGANLIGYRALLGPCIFRTDRPA